VSKTERALTSSENRGALDELFADDSFDAAFDEAVETADREYDIAGSPRNGSVVDVTPDAPADDVADVTDSDDIVDDAGAGGRVVSDGATVVDDSDAAEEHLIADEGLDLDDSHDSADPAGATRVDAGEGADGSAGIVHDDERGVEDLAVDLEPVGADDDGVTADLLAPSRHAVVDDDTPVNEPPPVEPSVARAEPDADEEASDRILEELRQAQIDGPVVAFAPQDDTTAARRRPRQSADYDPAPVPIPAKVPRVLGRKARVRRVTRVVRHVDPWSVFKIALVANFVMYVIVLTASVLLWNVAYATGTIDNVERFFESFGWDTFEFNGGELYHAGWIAGLFVVIGFTGLAVLGATLFNLITDLVGGVRLTVLEEEVVETRQSPMRRFVVRRSEPEVPAVIRDGTGAMYREAVVDDTGANVRPTR
jgi:hypothetical protein